MEIHKLNPELKTFLKVLQKSGYPNPTPDVPTIDKAVSYPLDDVWNEADMGDMGEVSDYVDEIGYECQDVILRKTGFVIHYDSQI